MNVAPQYRTFWRRFWAGNIDLLVFVPAMILDYWIWRHPTPHAVRVLWFVVFSVSFPAYSILMHGYSGQTVGKRVLGVRVIDVSGQALTMAQAVRREAINLPFFVWSFVAGLALIVGGGNPYDVSKAAYGPLDGLNLGVFALELLTTLTNSKRRALHDLIAASVVIRNGLAGKQR